ncbi:MAG: SulP family inorganic anion transporter [Cytophagales bacterium]|nr:SulP family inorganic anion transporter [Cytophagales bacterium]
MEKAKWLNYLKSDLPSSIVVFFVALPLCLGIALASGAPLFSGILAGIVGGIVVGSLSGSRVGVSGPAAGLAAIVLSAIAALGSYENFLAAVVLGGAIQLVLSLLRAGVIAYFFPSSVIKGMLTGIGIIIILKQIPHFFGYDASPGGDFSFMQMDGQNTLSELVHMFGSIQPGSALIGAIGLAVLVFWEKVLSKKGKIFKLVQGPLVAVAASIGFTFLVSESDFWAIAPAHLVSVPLVGSWEEVSGVLRFPNLGAFSDPKVWVTGFTIALVASLETLLCVEATDKLDPAKNVTPTNRELFAQGVGNMVSGLIGGLPITQVIVRSSANIQSGSKSKLSAVLHGFLLLLSVAAIPALLNKIPLSVLAAVLLIVGYKLAKPQLFVQMWKLGWKQFLPFIVTILGIVFTDLLIGISLGLGVGIVVILVKSFHNSHFLHKENKINGETNVKMTLAEEVTFFNKGAILKELDRVPEESRLELNVKYTQYLDHDILEILNDFVPKARSKRITVKLITSDGEYENPEDFRALIAGKWKKAG